MFEFNQRTNLECSECGPEYTPTRDVVALFNLVGDRPPDDLYLAAGIWREKKLRWQRSYEFLARPKVVRIIPRRCVPRRENEARYLKPGETKETMDRTTDRIDVRVDV